MNEMSVATDKRQEVVINTSMRNIFVNADPHLINYLKSIIVSNSLEPERILSTYFQIPLEDNEYLIGVDFNGSKTGRKV